MFSFLCGVTKRIMGGVTQSWVYWWNVFKNVFHVNEFNITGSITLGPGLQEISIDTDFANPLSVFLNVEEPDDGGVTTCIGDVNWVAARVVNTGFVLYANIASNSATVQYIVKYGDMTPNPKQQ